MPVARDKLGRGLNEPAADKVQVVFNSSAPPNFADEELADRVQHNHLLRQQALGMPDADSAAGKISGQHFTTDRLAAWFLLVRINGRLRNAGKFQSLKSPGLETLVVARLRTPVGRLIRR
jgi:hypothetical protein